MHKYIDADLLIGKELIPLTKRLDCCHPEQMKGVLMAMSKIDSAPAADVQKVRHGVWLPILESEITGWNPEFAGRDPVGGYICSICKNEAIYSCNDEWVLSAFCPYCGARVDGDEE